MDILDAKGDLDRGKVMDRLEEILAIDTSSKGRLDDIKKGVIDLIDEAVEMAFANACSDMQDIA